VPVVAENVFHHVTDEALVLLELPREAREAGVFLAGDNRLCLLDQLGPSARRRKFIFLQQVLAVIEQARIDKERHAVDRAGVRIGADRRGKEFLCASRGKKRSSGSAQPADANSAGQITSMKKTSISRSRFRNFCASRS